MQFKTIDPCFRDASLLSILSSSVLGLVLGFCGTGGNLMAMCWPFLGVGIRPWLLGLFSWSQLLLHQPCRKVADMRGCVAGQGSPCQEASPWAEISNPSGRAHNFIPHYPFPSAEDTRMCRVVSSPGSTPCTCSLQAYYGEQC